MARLNPQGMSTKSLLDLYNEHAQELGERPVNKFADREVAERRTIDMHDRVVAVRKAKAEAEKPAHVPTPQVAPLPGMEPLGLRGAAQDAIAAQPEQRAVVGSAKAPKWARPKEEKPGAKAYRPKGGTSQAAIYDLLVVPEGMDIEQFCLAMNKTLKPGVSDWTPSNTWSCLRYLFCAGKGYGLRFDGKRLWLLVPRVEVSHAMKGEGQ